MPPRAPAPRRSAMRHQLQMLARWAIERPSNTARFKDLVVSYLSNRNQDADAQPPALPARGRLVEGAQRSLLGPYSPRGGQPSRRPWQVLRDQGREHWDSRCRRADRGMEEVGGRARRGKTALHTHTHSRKARSSKSSSLARSRTHAPSQCNRQSRTEHRHGPDHPRRVPDPRALQGERRGERDRVARSGAQRRSDAAAQRRSECMRVFDARAPKPNPTNTTHITHHNATPNDSPTSTRSSAATPSSACPTTSTPPGE